MPNHVCTIVFTLLIGVSVGAQDRLWYHSITAQPNLIDGHPVDIYNLAEDDLGYHWYTTNNGLYRFDGYEFVPAPASAVDSLSAGTLLPRLLRLHSPGYLVTGSSYGFVDWFSTSAGTVQRWALFKEEDFTNRNIIQSVRTLHIDDDGTIWAGASLGLYRMRPGSTQVERFIPFEVPAVINEWIDDPNIVWSISDHSEDPNLLIVGAQGGLGIFDKTASKFVQLGLEGRTVNLAYHEPTTGQIFTSLWQEGLVTLDDALSPTGEYPLAQNLAAVWSVLKINPDTLLFPAADLGFIYFDLRTNTLIQSDDPVINPALQTPGRLEIWHFTDRYGAFWFRKRDHMLRVTHNDSIDKIAHPLRITGLSLPGRPPVTVHGDSAIVLPSGERNCQIKFAAVTPARPDSVQYAYRLNDGRWIEVGKNRQVAFSNLSHGTHQVHLRAVDPGTFGTITNTPGVLIVSLPFWQRPLVQLTGALLLLAVLAGAWIVRSRQVKSQQRIAALEKNYAELELTALRSQMNPHFMFNSLNSIRNFILQSERREAAEYLSRFSHLIRMILQNSREKYISLKEELDALMLYIDLEKLRFDDEFTFQCIIDETVNLEDVAIPPMILQPYVENAIWHGLMHKDEKGSLTLTVGKLNGQIECIIEDDGVGRERARTLRSKSATTHKSMGMGITEDRMALHNRMHQLGIHVEIIDKISSTGDPEGTRVIVRIPAKRTIDA